MAPLIRTRVEARQSGDKRYFSGTTCKNGHVSERYVSNQACVSCCEIQSPAWHKSNRERSIELSHNWHANNKERHNEQIREWGRANKERKLLIGARATAKRHGIAFNIDISDVVIPEICPVLGTRLDRYAPPRSHNLPSLDRIDSSRGYVKGNVCVISWRANRVKDNASLAELRALVRYVSQKSLSASDIPIDTDVSIPYVTSIEVSEACL